MLTVFNQRDAFVAERRMRFLQMLGRNIQRVTRMDFGERCFKCGLVPTSDAGRIRCPQCHRERGVQTPAV